MNIIELTLPVPSDILVKLTKKVADNAPINPDNKRWLDEFHNNKINSALHLFGIFDQDVNQQVLLEFQNFFPKHTINAGVSIMKPASNVPACMPPHCDRGRMLAINYYISHGGDQVETLFYSVERDTKGEAYNIPLNETGNIKHKTIFSNGWYSFDANRAHGVENIEDTRIILTIKFTGFETIYNTDQLVTDYPELIKNRQEIL